MGVQAVTMYTSFPAAIFKGAFPLGELNNIWISMINTDEGTPAADDTRHFYQITGSGPTYAIGYNPLKLSGARLFQEGDDLVFAANNVTFRKTTREDDEWGVHPVGPYSRNPVASHCTIWYARPGASRPQGLMCFFSVNWGSMFSTGIETITWNDNGIFRCKLEGS